MVVGIDASRMRRKFKTGTQWYGYHVIEGLKKIPAPDGVYFILYSQRSLHGDLGKLPERFSEKQLRWPLKYVWTHIRLCWELRKHPPDVLFVPSHTLPFFINIKSVLTIHDICFETHPQCYSWLTKIYYTMVHRRGARRAKTIIVPSQFTKNQLIKLYNADKDKIRVTPLAYDKDNFYVVNDEEKINAVLHKYNIKKPYFLFVGRLEEKKNIRELVRAYTKLRIDNTQLAIPNLVLVGSAGYGYKKIKKTKNVYEIGYAASDDLKYLYNAATAFIFPSLCEGFGIPILEAMACGCPIIASKSGSLPEVGGNAALYVDPHNKDSMVQAMKKIITDKNLVNKLTQKGLDRVNNFSWEKCAQQTMDILMKSETLNSKPQ